VGHTIEEPFGSQVTLPFSPLLVAYRIPGGAPRSTLQGGALACGRGAVCVAMRVAQGRRTP
jgi:hypothetical protein